MQNQGVMGIGMSGRQGESRYLIWVLFYRNWLSVVRFMNEDTEDLLKRDRQFWGKYEDPGRTLGGAS